MAAKALLIIDMQAGSFTPSTPRYESDIVIEKINQLTTIFRAKSNPGIFIRHDGSREGCYIPGTDDWQILPELNQLPGDLYVEKTINDSFYQSELQSTLQKLGANDLYFVGCATDFCFDTTVKSALGKDYNVTVVKDGHTTADRPFANAKTLIDHYNWLWSELTPAAYPLKVATCLEIIESAMK
ncbi:MAG: cysteine hydrolase family protein [Bacteroidia bacterium]|nr:cysteine hydrolase family protein [Bacteroidia bacterium]